MRRYGKYEKRPEVAAKKQPKVKSALLQTYLTSLLCMILCVTMFFGTTYAWFTSEVNNTANEIYIGILNVELEKKLTDGTWTSLSEKENDVNKANLFDKDIRWEPGYTALKTVKIKNEGDLDFRYVLTFTDGKVNGSVDELLLKTLAENFLVYVHAGDYEEGEEKPETLADMEASPNWTPVLLDQTAATLADILEKEIPVLSGNTEGVSTDTAVTTDSAEDDSGDSKPSEDVYIIALHMKEDASDENLMGQRINLNVKLVAYQMAYRQDGVDNTD